jgi:hypothetical protein
MLDGEEVVLAGVDRQGEGFEVDIVRSTGVKEGGDAAAF